MLQLKKYKKWKLWANTEKKRLNNALQKKKSTLRWPAEHLLTQSATAGCYRDHVTAFIYRAVGEIFGWKQQAARSRRWPWTVAGFDHAHKSKRGWKITSTHILICMCKRRGARRDAHTLSSRENRSLRLVKLRSIWLNVLLKKPHTSVRREERAGKNLGVSGRRGRGEGRKEARKEQK